MADFHYYTNHKVAKSLLLWIVWLCLEQAVGWANWPSKSLLGPNFWNFLKKRCQNICNLWVGKNIRGCVVLVFFIGGKSELGGLPDSKSVRLCTSSQLRSANNPWVPAACQAVSQTLRWVPGFEKTTAPLCERGNELISYIFVWEHQKMKSEDLKRKQNKGQSTEVIRPHNVLSCTQPQNVKVSPCPRVVVLGL